MTSLRNEQRKPQLWLDSGLILALNTNGTFSSILYRGKGILSKWKIASEETSTDELRMLKDKVADSYTKSYRLKGIGSDIIDDDMVLKLKMIAEHYVKSWLMMKSR